MLKTQEERQGAVLCPDDRRGGTIPRAVRVSENTMDGSLIVCATILCDIEKIMFVTNGGHYVV